MASLSSERRLRIMFDIIRAIHCLHTEKSDNFILFHRDIKSANICLERNYTAKLIDCGLAKFVPVDDSISTSAFPISVRNTSHVGVFGTPGYTCPWYSRGHKTFEASCDVFSFGIVMIELVTGCLQNDKNKLGDFYDRYIQECAGYSLVDDVVHDLTYLVLADPASTSSKAEKARKLGVEVISEDQLISLLG